MNAINITPNNVTGFTDEGAFVSREHYCSSFVGNKYNKELVAADIKKMITRFIKTLPGVTAKVAARGKRLEVIITGMPCEKFSDCYNEYIAEGGNPYKFAAPDSDLFYTDEAAAIKNSIASFIKQYHLNESDNMADHSSYNFWFCVEFA